jgi:DNA-binding MarR family transcriptional regulator
MSSSEKADQAWEIMRALVTDDDRRAEVSDALGMSFMRSKALRRIAARASTLRELAANLCTDAPYATIVVHDLEERGFVTRTSNPSDGRSKMVQVTPAGERAAKLAEEILGRPPVGLSALPTSEISQLLEILQHALVAPAPISL